MLANEIKHGLFDAWPKRLNRIICQRKAAPVVGVQVADRRMRTMRGERHRKPPGRDAEASRQKRIQRMRGMSFRPRLADHTRSSGRRLFPLRRNAGRSDTPTKRGRVRPCEPRGLRFSNHRLLHAARTARRMYEPGGLSCGNSARLCGAGEFRLNDANSDRKRIGERLRAQHGGAGARACRRNGHQLAHPIEGDNRDPMRAAETNCLDRDDAAPSGHDDRRRHARAGIVSEPPLTIVDKERAAFDRKACVVGFRRDDAGLDRKPSLPKGVAFRVRPRLRAGVGVGYRAAIACIWPLAAFRWFGEGRLPQAQQSLPRRPAVRPCGCFGISAIDGGPGRASGKPRQRRVKVYWIAARPPHAATLRWPARRVILGCGQAHVPALAFAHLLARGASPTALSAPQLAMTAATGQASQRPPERLVAMAGAMVGAAGRKVLKRRAVSLYLQAAL
jgi:hypothetical protein